mmetsp:Transcript_19956/g.32737  ORF Transcript_19956/g.32737 Transcript_19956/m.32737 type:complete len:165 (-) Transcript_19956:106-600(-)|eukprot:CAMPEP_0184675424 /NCGR_PEP_ID=MMETSP0308-20130426/87765_1 /TAXON_ID=38269 /ORGANISM="Gloeochaete witrockiana, Strain SAG 46.84" /LENGTH=164 /DNA_ID=CAMNT_0027123125 /DNA_START=98 /DNA_END=592 /DNA_ORIENTATION=-
MDFFDEEPAAEFSAPQPPLEDGFFQPEPALSGRPGASGPIPLPLETMLESDAMRAFREQQASELAAKSQRSKEAQAGKQAKAQVELEQFYQERKAKLESTLISKREADQEVRKVLDSVPEAATWSGVCSLTDLDEKIIKHTSDVSRYRVLLRDLKEHPIPLEVQ